MAPPPERLSVLRLVLRVVEAAADANGRSAAASKPTRR